MAQILIYGPHADEYSLAKVNRGLAIALAKQIAAEKPDWQVKLSADPSAVSRVANKQDFQNYPDLENIYEDFDPAKQWDIIIYNNFPKDANSLHGLANLNSVQKFAYLAWEESRLPERWVNEFNANLDGVFAASLHTRTVLENSGVTVPIVIIPNALSQEFLSYGQTISAAQGSVAAQKLIKTKKSYKFFHNSSGMSRKSPEALITAFSNEFSSNDDVALVIKSFPNINNALPELIKIAQTRVSCPEIELIMDYDLTDQDMAALYQACDATISCSRAEGFNLPALESMYLGTTLLVTAWSGQMDFCDDSNAYLLDYELQPARSHLDNPGAFWAEVNGQDLRNKLRQVYSEKGGDKQAALIANAKGLTQNYTWGQSAATLLKCLQNSQGLRATKKIHLGVLSTYNTVCGIAEYSKYLYKHLGSSFASLIIIANNDVVGRVAPDAGNIVRLWEYNELDFADVFSWLDAEEQKLGRKPLDVVHIQFSIGHFSYPSLSKLIQGLHSRGVKIILTAHSVQVSGAEIAEIKADLLLCSQIHVLNSKDLDYLRNLGLTNCTYFPHGNSSFPGQSRSRLRQRLDIVPESGPIIASHGFMVENKGLLETLEAIKILVKEYPNLLYIALNAVNPRNISSAAMDKQFSQQILEFGLQNNVLHIPDFLETVEIQTILSTADIAVFAYPEAKETASGAIRLALSAKIPTIITQSSQLSDLQDIAYVVNTNQPGTIVAGIKALLQSPELAAKIKQNISTYTVSHDWQLLDLSYVKLISLAL